MTKSDGFFVTGTGTGIGKTVASAVLVAALRKEGPVKYWKPVQTGIESDDDTLTVKELAGCSENEILNMGIRLERPLSPHLSARLAGSPFSIEDVLEFENEESGPEVWIVEGAGGVLVPLNDDEMMIDLIGRLGLSVLVVASSGLGTINHTLLTIFALRDRGLETAGVILNGPQNSENRDAIEKFGDIKVVAEIPTFAEISQTVIMSFAKELVLDL